VRAPMKQYLGSSVSLLKGYASTFPAFKQTGGKTAADIDSSFSALTPEDLDALLEHSFGRYYETGGLFGTPDSCAAMIADVQAVGVDEIACLIDFGVPTDVVLNGLVQLNTLRQRSDNVSGRSGGRW
jgi:alkanesulfonate monooxygenase SsuD/methylene tetrahydromethanopterin reductase-like flavin-dependent oxidoreductase (luciferase family)